MHQFAPKFTTGFWLDQAVELTMKGKAAEAFRLDKSGLLGADNPSGFDIQRARHPGALGLRVIPAFIFKPLMGYGHRLIWTSCARRMPMGRRRAIPLG